MAIIEIQAKTMLASITHPDPIFGLRYNMNLYRGCQHQCIYCDSRSECYGIENFNQDVLVKVNAIELLEKELPRKRVKGVIGTGSMNDPYMPLEKRYNLTGRALALIARHGFGVHVITKSDLVLRDLELLSAIRKVHALVSFTVTTADDDLSRKIEPGAPVSSARFAAMKAVADRSIYTGVSMMPILPFLEDTPENITAIVQRAADNGASYIVPWFGLSMRDRQRVHLYTQLDRLFPGLRVQYEQRYGERYDCAAPNAARLREVFKNVCQKYGLAERVPQYQPAAKPEQLSLFRS
jgi:DNA repair photolyase